MESCQIVLADTYLALLTIECQELYYDKIRVIVNYDGSTTTNSRLYY